MSPDDFTFEHHFWRRTVYVPMFGTELEVSIDAEDFRSAPPTSRQLDAADTALQLSLSLRDLLDDAAELYRLKVHEAVGLTWPEVAGINRSNIREHYRVDSIFVPRLRSCPNNFLFLHGECDWEDEHGIEFLLRDGRILQCGPQDGLAQNESWNDYIAASA